MKNITGQENKFLQSKNQYLAVAVACILLIVLGFVFFHGIGRRPLIEFDESIYAQVAQQVLHSKNYLGFKWLGNTSMQKPWLGREGMVRTDYWFEKPPLMVWLIAAAYKIMGVSEFASRIWIAVFALLTAAMAGWFAKTLKNRTAGILTLSFFFLCFQFIYDAKILQFDIPVGFFILASNFFFYLAQKNTKYYYAFWAAVAFGVMTKSVIGLLPLPILFIYSLLMNNWSYFKQKHLWFGCLLFLALILPWHIYEHLKYGRAFWEQYLFYHVLERFATPLEGNNGDNKWYFYLEVLYRARALFWSSIITLTFGLWQSFRKNFKYLIPITASLFILVFFTVSKTKLITYLLIIYPWLAILNGIGWSEIVKLIFKNNLGLRYLGYSLIVIICVTLGIKYSTYDGKKPVPQLDADNKALGLFLGQNYPDLRTYNYSGVGTKPSAIFYANMPIYFLPKDSSRPEQNFLLISDSGPVYQKSKNLLTTESGNLYLIFQ